MLRNICKGLSKIVVEIICVYQEFNVLMIKIVFYRIVEDLVLSKLIR